MDDATELGRNPVCKHQIQPKFENEQADTTGLPNSSHETKLPGANADRKVFIFPVQLTTSRSGKLPRLIYLSAICATIQTYSN